MNNKADPKKSYLGELINSFANQFSNSTMALGMHPLNEMEILRNDLTVQTVARVRPSAESEL